MRVEQKEYKNIRYLLYYPKNYVEGKKYPVMFHLHGSGSRGDDFSAFNGSTILNILEKEDSPLSDGFCVFPQCHKDTWFDIFSDLLSLVEHIYNQEFTDPNKFTGSGISMGGYGIYQVMMSKPELFTKAIVCCGGGMYWNSGRLKTIKIRIFHGKLDEAVYPEEAIRMYNRLVSDGADVELKLYDDTNHNCWDVTYSNYENLKWLFE